MQVKKIFGKAAGGIKRGVKYAVPLLAAAICEQTSKKIVEDVQYCGELNYGDAVKAIVESDMYSNDKTKSISLIRESGQASYYKAIVAIARNSSMFSNDKYKAIANITKGE